jgi:hypothetical protein
MSVSAAPSTFSRMNSAAISAWRSSRPSAQWSIFALASCGEPQDCERNAVKRWFDKHHARLAPLRPVYLGDDLFACQPIAAMVKDNGFTIPPELLKNQKIE